MSLNHDRLLIGWGDSSRFSFKEKDNSKPAFYISDFFLTSPSPWVQYSKWMEIERGDFSKELESQLFFDSSNWVIDQPETFRNAFKELQQLLFSQTLKKGVPYLFCRSSTQMTLSRLQFTLQKGLDHLKKKSGFLYGYWDASHGVLGITPELLFSHEEKFPQTVHTMALAGTSSLKQSQEEFINSEKERREHQLVVEDIYKKLQLLGEVKVGEVQLCDVSPLIHMKSSMTANLREPFNFDQLVNLLHPTPALGTFPSQEGRGWLRRFEQHTPRHYYGAPIGFQTICSEISKCFVAIRNVQWDSSGMRIGAGCGVIQQSLYEREWDEIQFKIKAIREQFHL